MLNIEGQRIRDLREINFSNLEFEDLRWQYGVFQSTSTGSGRHKEYGSWTGVKTSIGEIEESVWYQAAERLIHQKGEQKILDALTQWGMEHNYLRESPSQIRKAAMQLHIDRIFENPRWVDFVPFNRRYRPEVLKTAHLVTVVNECCQKTGVVTQEQIDAAYKGTIACPCCGKWSHFDIVDSSHDISEHQAEQINEVEMI